MTDIEGSSNAWKSEASPLSYWNAPQAAKTSQRLGEPLSATGPYSTVFDMTAVATPVVQQLYNFSTVKHQPGYSLRTKQGEFVDFGTKLYQLELQLSYKDNEINVLEKKLKKFAQELYPNGSSSKKSAVAILQNKCTAIQTKLETKERQLKWEKRRCKGLEHELAQAKKLNLEMRKENLTKNKAVQTLPDNNKQTQISTAPRKPSVRNITTQCTPTVVKVTNTTRITPEKRENSTNLHTESRNAVKAQKIAFQRVLTPPRRSHNGVNSTSSLISSCSGSSLSSTVAIRTGASTRGTNVKGRASSENMTVENQLKVEMVPDNNRRTLGNTDDSRLTSSSNAIVVRRSPSPRINTNVPSKPGVKFATSMTIREDPNTREKAKPLEMAITQEFAKGQVKTVVESNREFQISERPALVTQNGNEILPIPPSYQNYEAYQKPSGHGYLKPSRSIDADSGMSSYDATEDVVPGSYNMYGIGQMSPATRSNKVSYTQLLSDDRVNSGGTNGRMFERNLHDYMQPVYPASLHPNPSMRNTSPLGISSSSKITTSSSLLTPKEIYERNTVTKGPGAMIPYYLFRRSDGVKVERDRSQEKPIYVHVSEITM